MTTGQVAWLIERRVNGRCEWIAIRNDCPYWTPDPGLPLRFARKFEAEMAWLHFRDTTSLGLENHAWFIVEHQWCSGPDLREPYTLGNYHTEGERAMPDFDMSRPIGPPHESSDPDDPRPTREPRLHGPDYNLNFALADAAWGAREVARMRAMLPWKCRDAFKQGVVAGYVNGMSVSESISDALRRFPDNRPAPPEETTPP